MIFSALNARSEETQATGRAIIISLHLLIVEAFSLTIRDGSGLVNCPTQPTCIAHCDLCICQLSRRWQPSLALSKMFEPSHRP